MLKISNIKIYEDLSDSELIEKVINKYKIKKSDIINWHIIKKSIDARKKDDIYYNYTIELEVKNENFYSRIEKSAKTNIPSLKLPNLKFNDKNSPVIIGAGPAGLFAALTFVENGIRPIIIEQGKKVEDRQKDVDNFIKNRILNVNSNIQFGEGGAGTFSDGKLTTGISSSYCKTVLHQFVKFGAPEQILYLQKPHIGTDILIKVISNMRNYIIQNGGTFYFNTQLIDFNIQNSRVTSIIVKDVITNDIREFSTSQVILAIGHSSRKTFQLIYKKGLLVEPKNFSVGVRIEHLQSMINNSQYGSSSKLNLPPAEYKLAYHSPSGRSCYTFCMCPGGTVMASSSEENTIVTNGMSKFARDGINSNSALLVNVTPSDFSSNSPLAGIDFQQDLEEKAFKLGGSNYNAPIQKVSDFINNTISEKIGTVSPTYLPGTKFANLNTILPEFVSNTLKEGILYFDSKIKGFANPDSILTGVETRSSSPVKILRNENLESNILGIYPCGEGAGYAGGIMSASVDGIKCAFGTFGNVGDTPNCF